MGLQSPKKEFVEHWMNLITIITSALHCLSKTLPFSASGMHVGMHMMLLFSCVWHLLYSEKVPAGGEGHRE